MARSFASASSQYLYRNSGVVTSAPLTIAAWVYPLNTNVTKAVVTIQKAAVNNDRFMLYCGPSAEVSFQTARGTTYATASAASSYSANAWSHVAGVASAANSRYAYLNGVAGTQETTSATPAGIDRTFIALADQPTNYFSFNGRIAEVGVWSAALTTSEIAALAKGYSPLEIRPASLVAYYPLGGHYGQFDLDRWKNKYDLTPGNSPTWTDHPRVIYPGPIVAPIKATVASSTKYWNFARQATRIIGGGIGT